jgi:hypothetical protein
LHIGSVLPAIVLYGKHRNIPDHASSHPGTSLKVISFFTFFALSPGSNNQTPVKLLIKLLSNILLQPNDYRILLTSEA